MSSPLIYAPPGVSDTLGRPLHDLRISVTDRCNFRCTYCMPKEVFNRDFKFLDRSELLNFDEITRLARLFVSLGVRKIRLTGGEPLLRRDLPLLVQKLSELPGVEEVTLTTNGSLLAGQAGALKEAGLTRVTVSLDSLDNTVFTQMNDVDFPVERVLEGIEAATKAGLLPVKVNMVVKRGVNDDSVLEMARYFKGTGHILRFIEYMDVGSSNGWKMDEVVSSREIVETIHRELPLVPTTPNYSGEVAKRYRYADGSGEIGLISSVTQPFCSSCTRARLSAKGELYTCLFASRGTDLRALLRSGVDDGEISIALEELWRGRNDRYSQVRSSYTSKLHKVEMSHIGG